MEIATLRTENFRLAERLVIEFEPSWNLFIGPNGTGKTSVLEAIYLLSHGRSFRTAAKEVLVRQGSNGFSIYGEVVRAARGTTSRVGISGSGNRLRAWLGGRAVAVGDLLRTTAVSCFEPGSHELISGGSEIRRRFLDWGVFHVEPDFLGAWRRYQRALKQRNTLLRNDASRGNLDIWDRELTEAAEPLTQMRTAYFQAWQPLARSVLTQLLGELGAPRLEFNPGVDPQLPLAAMLATRRERDQMRGYTSVGPHRADWSISFAEAPRREHLSRGQEKLCAFGCVMSQAMLCAERARDWPIFCLDDISSELDADHQVRILSLLDASGAQVLATATADLDAFGSVSNHRVARFHVERGGVGRLV